jgi:hypothetical protein
MSTIRDSYNDFRRRDDFAEPEPYIEYPIQIRMRASSTPGKKHTRDRDGCRRSTEDVKPIPKLVEG